MRSKQYMIQTTDKVAQAARRAGTAIGTPFKSIPRASNRSDPLRLVHYQSYGKPGGEFKSDSRAAIVTAVEYE